MHFITIISPKHWHTVLLFQNSVHTVKTSFLSPSSQNPFNSVPASLCIVQLYYLFISYLLDCQHLCLYTTKCNYVLTNDKMMESYREIQLSLSSFWLVTAQWCRGNNIGITGIWLAESGFGITVKLVSDSVKKFIWFAKWIWNWFHCETETGFVNRIPPTLLHTVKVN